MSQSSFHRESMSTPLLRIVASIVGRFVRLRFVLLFALGLTGSNAALACPSGYECTTPVYTSWCIGIDHIGDYPYPGCFATEADAKAWRLAAAQQQYPQCNYYTIQDKSDWRLDNCWVSTSACYFPTVYTKFATVMGEQTAPCTVYAYDSANMGATRQVSCPTGYAADSTIGLCKRSKADCCSIGDGVSPASTGDKRANTTDFTGGGPFPLSFGWSYSSGMADVSESPGLNTQTRPPYLGSRWRHSLQKRVTVYSATPAVASLLRPAETVRYFDLVAGNWVGRGPEKGRLVETKDGQGVRIGWTYTTGSDEAELYDATGRLLSATSRTGLVQSLAYDDSGRLASVTDAFGRQLLLEYSAGLPTLLTLPSGATYQYSYDNQANLTAVTGPDYFARTYLYNELPYSPGGSSYAGFLTGLLDENGARYGTYSYNSSRTIATAHAAGADSWIFNYPSPFAPVITDPQGAQRTFTYTLVAGAYRLTQVTVPCAHCGDAPSQIAYDANGNVASRTDFNNKKVCYAYDLNRNLETARAEGILSAEACSTVLTTLPARADVRKASAQWHAIWRLPTKIAEPNRLTTNAYNGDGGIFCAPTSALVAGNPIGVLCKKTVQATTDATGQQGFTATTTGTPRIWQYTYDAYGQVLTATDPNGKVTATTYYAANDPDLGKRGNAQTVTNPLGHVTTFTAYDANGRPLSITDPNGVVTTLTYHPRGWLTSRTVAGETTVYDYDGVGQLTKVTQPDGSYLQYTYDAAHRLTQIQDGLGNKVVYTLDAMGNRIEERAYDPGGTLARTRQQVFDSLNRLHQSVGAQ